MYPCSPAALEFADEALEEWGGVALEGAYCGGSPAAHPATSASPASAVHHRIARWWLPKTAIRRPEEIRPLEIGLEIDAEGNGYRSGCR